MSSDSQEDGRSRDEDGGQVGCLGHVWVENPREFAGGLDVSNERDRGSGMIPSLGGGQATGSMDESAGELGGRGQATGLKEKSGVPFGCLRPEMPTNSLCREIKSIHWNK